MEQVRAVLEALQRGESSVDEALTALRWAPFEDLGYARLDTHRALRTGVPEVVYCAGKPPGQVAAIFERLFARGGVVMGTRATAEHYAAVVEALPSAVLRSPASSSDWP